MIQAVFGGKEISGKWRISLYLDVRVLSSELPLPTHGMWLAMTVIFSTLASSGSAAIANTVFAASSTRKVGSGITVPFACGIPALIE